MSWLFTLFSGFAAFSWQQATMLVIGGVMIFLAIRKGLEPALLLPMGFGTILVNLPFVQTAALSALFDAGISHELFPLLLFIGIGAMLDFGPLLKEPKLALFGAAAQAGILCTFFLARALHFPLADAASVAIIGAADGPTAIYVSNYFHSAYQGAILVAAYSYMALVPVLQPPVIRLLTTRHERGIHMEYRPGEVKKLTRILFPILVTILAATLAPQSAELIGFLMFGNLIRECGVLDALSKTAQHELANLVTLLLGFSVSLSLKADTFLRPDTLIVLALGLFAFTLDTAGGVLLAKLLNLFCRKKVNPMVGAAGISAFPMSARTVQKLGLEADPYNHLLMHAAGANIAGQIFSVLAGGLLISFVEARL
ncbi:MAG: sodium ion-translocating decarboxylase subunit beta [Oscillibacter sp.]|jgi:oxaloacetate decarboxylase beta subunit|nr:sodium ion-translocating decarboxylase subunit beta [Oscillibacter sp.]